MACRCHTAAVQMAHEIPAGTQAIRVDQNGRFVSVGMLAASAPHAFSWSEDDGQMIPWHACAPTDTAEGSTGFKRQRGADRFLLVAAAAKKANMSEQLFAFMTGERCAGECVHCKRFQLWMCCPQATCTWTWMMCASTSVFNCAPAA